MKQWRRIECETVANYAKIDGERSLRTGFPEVVYAEGKSVAQIEGILLRMVDQHGEALATRLSEDQLNQLEDPIFKTQFTYFSAPQILASNELVESSKTKPQQQVGPLASWRSHSSPFEGNNCSRMCRDIGCTHR